MKVICSYCNCLPIMAHAQTLGDLLAINILKGGTKKDIARKNKEILGFSENYYSKLLQALYYRIYTDLYWLAVSNNLYWLSCLVIPGASFLAYAEERLTDEKLPKWCQLLQDCHHFDARILQFVGKRKNINFGT